MFLPLNKYYSPKHVSQLLAPLNVMFCAASLCQDNSSKSSPIICDEVGEHMARDLRLFLHTVSLQILQILRSALVDSASAHPTFSMGFRSGDCEGHGKTFILQAVIHFCVDLEVCFGSLSCWKVQPRPILSFLEGAVRLSFNICWYLMESIIPCVLTRCPGHLEEKQPHNIKDPPPYFTVGMRCFSVWLSFCLRQTHL